MTAARAASSINRFTKTWADCSVYIKISPRPQNLAESREVLRVLQQYGEVVMYRHLKYEAPTPTLNAALAIYRSQNAAAAAIQASPICFQFQQTSDGLSSKIMHDDKSIGSRETAGYVGEQRQASHRESDMQSTQSFAANINNSHKEDVDEQLQRQANNTSEDLATPGNDAQLRFDDEWRNDFFDTANDVQQTSRDAAKPTPLGTFSPNFAPRQTLRRKPSRKPMKKSPQDIAAELIAIARNATAPQRGKNYMQQDPPPTNRQLQLTVAKSVFNHQAYIERQAYYAGFNPDMKTIMAEDLKDRVPMEGLVDCNINKGDIPLRLRLKRKGQDRSRVSLKEMWENGRRERGEI
ncbi:MAG: hypothetical protein Q9220_002576 [cf. Caloplaca sp. 1 TL-2023]